MMYSAFFRCLYHVALKLLLLFLLLPSPEPLLKSHYVPRFMPNVLHTLRLLIHQLIDFIIILNFHMGNFKLRGYITCPNNAASKWWNLVAHFLFLSRLPHYI